MSELQKVEMKGTGRKYLVQLTKLPTAPLQVQRDPLYLRSCLVTPLLMEEELWAHIDWQRAARSQPHIYHALLQKLKEMMHSLRKTP